MSNGKNTDIVIGNKNYDEIKVAKSVKISTDQFFYPKESGLFIVI